MHCQSLGGSTNAVNPASAVDRIGIRLVVPPAAPPRPPSRRVPNTVADEFEGLNPRETTAVFDTPPSHRRPVELAIDLSQRPHPNGVAAPASEVLTLTTEGDHNDHAVHLGRIIPNLSCGCGPATSSAQRPRPGCRSRTSGLVGHTRASVATAVARAADPTQVSATGQPDTRGRASSNGSDTLAAPSSCSGRCCLAPTGCTSAAGRGGHRPPVADDGVADSLSGVEDDRNQPSRRHRNLPSGGTA